jgi:hypothetical protein
MSKKFAYKDRAFMVYDTNNVIMDKAKAHCRRYGYTLSKLALIALAEKLERDGMNEGEKQLAQLNGVMGVQATTLATPATPTPLEVIVPMESHTILYHNEGGPGT